MGGQPRRHTDKFFLRKQRKYAERSVEARTITFLTYRDDDLLVFIDDSGEILPGTQADRFFMGGIAVHGRDYRRMDADWISLKSELFGRSAKEFVHATEDLDRLSPGGRWKLEAFLAHARFNAVWGFEPPGNLYGKEAAALLRATNPLAIIRSMIDQMHPRQGRRERWIVESSGKQDRLMMERHHQGRGCMDFLPSGELSDVSFASKRDTPLSGLDMADIFVNQLRRSHPYGSPPFRDPRWPLGAVPPWVRLYQAAMGMPCAPFFSPHRLPARALDFLPAWSPHRSLS